MMRFREIFYWIGQWWNPVGSVPCPYCSNVDRLVTSHCSYSAENPQKNMHLTGADPPCLGDSFACKHRYQLGIGC